jgi:hypothetical protein
MNKNRSPAHQQIRKLKKKERSNRKEEQNSKNKGNNML